MNEYISIHPRGILFNVIEECVVAVEWNKLHSRVAL